MTGPQCETAYLGQIGYPQALRLQEKLVRLRRAGEIGDRLLLLEHPHVLTKGSSANDDHILVGVERQEQLGLEVYETGRGGDVTYHGPGQLVGYPILQLQPHERDAHAYLRRLEEVLIRTLGDWGLSAGRHPSYTGVWVEDAKVAAIGVRLSRWVTSHGFALNIDCDLTYFATIVPCGIADKRVTTMRELLGEAPSAAQVRRSVREHFSEVFQRELIALPGQA